MEKTGKKISHVTGVLARSVRIIIENILREGGALQEIRMRIGQPLTVMIDGEEQILPLKERAHIVTKEEIKETIEYMSRYSLYAYENELRQPLYRAYVRKNLPAETIKKTAHTPYAERGDQSGISEGIE